MVYIKHRGIVEKTNYNWYRLGDHNHVYVCTVQAVVIKLVVYIK